MSGPPRGSKHPRAPSAVSREAKRIRDDETVLSDMSVDKSTADIASKAGNGTSLRRKRENIGDSAKESDEEQDTESLTESAGEVSYRGIYEDDEAWLKRHNASASKGKGKVARTGKIDSPSQSKRRVGKGSADPFITSPPGSKAKGKRRVDDSDDHQIGDEWTDLNGLRWRMGDDGEMRREAVVMEMRLKYPNMPKDSRHADAKTMIPVLVERFLTEEEYEDMREKKLLGFQEEERRHVTEAAEAKRREAKEEEERKRRKAIADSGERTMSTPKRIRNIQALYESPLRKSASPSPLRAVLSSSEVPRSRSTSNVSFIAPTGSSSPSVPYKRLSLSMGSSTSAPTTPVPSDKIGAVSASGESEGKLPRSSKSLRVPLSAPSQHTHATTPGSSIKRMLGSIGDIVARRKREESLLSLLRSETEKRKKRELVK